MGSSRYSRNCKARRHICNCKLCTACNSCWFQKLAPAQQQSIGKLLVWIIGTFSAALPRTRQTLRRVYRAVQHFLRITSETLPLAGPTCTARRCPTVFTDTCYGSAPSCAEMRVKLNAMQCNAMQCNPIRFSSIPYPMRFRAARCVSMRIDSTQATANKFKSNHA